MGIISVKIITEYPEGTNALTRSELFKTVYLITFQKGFIMQETVLSLCNVSHLEKCRTFIARLFFELGVIDA